MTTPRDEIAEWIADALIHPVRQLTDFEVDALRAAVHFGSDQSCYNGAFEDCPDIWHTPPIDLEEWWPPRNASSARLA